jgi:hypothetical protein
MLKVPFLRMVTNAILLPLSVIFDAPLLRIVPLLFLVYVTKFTELLLCSEFATSSLNSPIVSRQATLVAFTNNCLTS